MTIDKKIKDEKLQYDIQGEARKTSVLSSGLINFAKYCIFSFLRRHTHKFLCLV